MHLPFRHLAAINIICRRAVATYVRENGSVKIVSVANCDIVKKNRKKTRDNRIKKRSKGRGLATCMRIKIDAIIGVELRARG